LLVRFAATVFRLSGTQQERTVCGRVRPTPMPALEDERAAVCATTPHACFIYVDSGEDIPQFECQKA